MALTPEQRDKLVSEIKQLSTALNLSDEQKQKTQDFLSSAYDKLQQYRQQNPNASKEDMIHRVTDQRTAIRQQLATLLSPKQLLQWEAEVEKIKDFLFLRIASAASA